VSSAHEHDVMQVHQHRDVRGGGARAAVFGISDGLVTNVSLVLGMAGANPGGSIVRLAGVAGLVAGSFSMAAGEYLSMTAQRELMERELEVERRSLRRSPEGEAAELRGIYVRRGIDPEVATDMVNEVMQDPDLALETHAREELGITEQGFGSPWQAAGSSFVTFALGAFIPLAPWLFTAGTTAIVLSVVLGALAALTVGVVQARFTERPPFASALRQLAVTAVAAAVTFGVGKAIGTGVS
jgi:vacuolar iron transporter family protein